MRVAGFLPRKEGTTTAAHTCPLLGFQHHRLNDWNGGAKQPFNGAEENYRQANKFVFRIGPESDHRLRLTRIR